MFDDWETDFPQLTDQSINQFFLFTDLSSSLNFWLLPLLICATACNNIWHILLVLEIIISNIYTNFGGLDIGDGTAH